MSQNHCFEVDGGGAGQRLDTWLSAMLPNHSRNEVQRWIKDGLVLVDGIVSKSKSKLDTNQSVTFTIPEVVQSRLEAEAIPLAIVYENIDLLVIDKPSGMVVHPAPGHPGGTLVNAVLHHCPDLEGVGGERRPGIVHRLDKETSGLIVVAKNDRTLRHLQAQFKARTVYKAYIALLEGQLTPRIGRTDAPIGRHPTQRQRQAVLLPDQSGTHSTARQAVTDWEVLGYYSGLTNDGGANFSLVRAIPHTGRTHQIRVHFSHLKHPVVGDSLYGFRRQRLVLDRQFLHAHKLRFHLSPNGKEREFTAELPPQLADLLHTFDVR